MQLLTKQNFTHFQTVRTFKDHMSSLKYLCYQMQIVKKKTGKNTRRAYVLQIVERFIKPGFTATFKYKNNNFEDAIKIQA